MVDARGVRSAAELDVTVSEPPPRVDQCAATVVYAFDRRQQFIVPPSEIKPGDWLVDLGTLRCVEYIDGIGDAVGSGVLHIVHFETQPGVPNFALGFSSSAPEITVWREPDQTVEETQS